MTAVKQDFKRLFLIEYIFLGLLAAAALFFALRNYLPKEDRPEGEAFQTVVLYGNDDPEDLRVLKEVLPHTTGSGAYELTEKENYLELRILPSALHGLTVSEYLEWYVTEPQKYAVVWQGAEDSTSTFHTMFALDELADMKLETGIAEENDVEAAENASEASESGDAENDADAHENESAETVSAENGGNDPEAEVPLLDFWGGEQRYVRFTFPENITEEIERHRAAGDVVALMNNRVYTDYETNNLIMENWVLENFDAETGSYTSFYNFFNPEYGNEEALRYIFTHETLKQPYNYLSVEDVVWERVEDLLASGENQCNEEDIDKDSYFISLSLGGYGDRPTRSEAAETKAVLCARLDLLQTPYAVGATAGGNLGIKIGADHINRGILSALVSGNGPCISVRDKTLGMGDITCFAEEGKRLRMTLEESMISSLKTELARSSRDRENIYLMLGELPVAKMAVPLPFSANELVWEDFCFTEGQGVNENLDWFLPFAQEICRNPAVPVTVRANYICYGGQYYNDSSRFGMKNPEVCDADEIREKVKDIDPQAEIKISDNSRILYVFLNLPVDEEMAGKIAAMCPAIYDAVGFEDAFFNYLYIYPCETGEDERAILSYVKRRDYTTGEWQVSFDTSFYNGRFEGFGDELRKLMK